MARYSGMREVFGTGGRALGLFIGATVSLIHAGGAGSSAPASTTDSLSVIIETADSSLGPWIRVVCTEAVDGIQTFFGVPYLRRVQVRVFPDRAALTAYWRSAWGIPGLQPECWQVASGTSSLLALLSPRTWRVGACDHDPADTTATRLLVVHELVHVFHAQRSPRPEFDGMDEVSWLVEGLATYASGQLDRIHAKAARSAIDAGVEPSDLAKAWSGKYRYGIAGSLVKYVDKTYGRAMLVALLSAVSQEEILRRLGVGEEELLKSWRRWVLAQSIG